MNETNVEAATELAESLRTVISSRGGLRISVDELRAVAPSSDDELLGLILNEWTEMGLLEKVDADGYLPTGGYSETCEILSSAESNKCRA